ncbi:LOW QUALITY PROTEIN: hypothetical protein ACHAWT_008061 [Skeletonema menzelii]
MNRAKWWFLQSSVESPSSHSLSSNGCRNLKPELITITTSTFWQVCILEAFHSNGAFRLDKERKVRERKRNDKKVLSCSYLLYSVLAAIFWCKFNVLLSG